MQYEELDLHAHTLKRPDTYVGSVHSEKSNEYIVNESLLNKKEIEYTPAILRIFIEALSNAIDNVSRSKQYNVLCKNIKVEINQETGETSVWNDGLSIPIKMHSTANTWIPDMLFGRLLTSSNYNDEEKRETSGRNGLGISLTNIFSKSFSIELVDPPSGKLYKQSWSDNMKVRNEPKITSTKLKKGYTKVSWIPDFAYFKIEKYTDDFYNLLYKYIFDAAMIVSKDNVAMYFNDVKLPIKTFKDYVKLYYEEESKELLYLSNAESQCAIIPSKSGYEEISFVNGIYTKEGGVHVEAWSENIFKGVAQKINTKFKTLKLTAREVKPYFKIFVNCTVPNPEFATQSKHKLVAPKYSVKVEQKDINTITSWQFMNEIKDMVDMKDKLVLKKSESKRAKRIDGFDPANKAGGKDSMKCTLILCEGLSAKTYAVMGIDEGSYFGEQYLKGRDWYGIMPLRGVVMNVRNSNSASILANKEIVNIIQALGVQHSVDYSLDENFKKLRYGRIMILTDADCFTADTPVLVQKHQLLHLITFKELYKTKDLSDVLIWDNYGWTELKAIQKKQSTKKIYSISTSTGFIQCTEDHKLILSNGVEKKASELKRGDSLMHSTMNYPKSKFEYKMNEEDAWLWGVFFNNVHISSVDISMSCTANMKDKIDRILKKTYSVEANVHKYNDNKYLLWFSKSQYPQVFNYIKTIISNESANESSNESSNKTVPICILNANESIQKIFYDAYMESNQSEIIEIYGQAGAQGMYIITQNIGLNYEIQPHFYNSNIWILKKKEDNNKDCIIQNIKIEENNGVDVYDVETQSHTLNAGIGRMIQHNCDGIHIQALILNMFNYLFPSLFQRKGFITCMSTPIMKVIYKNEIMRFYDLNSAKNYIQNHAHSKSLTIKYYKGLGTSSDKDVKDTFGQRVIQYTVDSETNKNIDLVFNKEHSNYRKQWLTEYKEKEIDLKDSTHKSQYWMDISEFINYELIKFSINDCKRSIPHLMDGLKESQRKILYACIKRNLQKPIKVAQLAGYVAENTNYHHGEGCLFDTITKMAQDFVGSNNLPLLFKDGQFGTRMQPNGSDAANARYIFTKLAPITRSIIHPEDDDILTYLDDDGDRIEPEYYAPIIPMVLVNGANGIATGWSTTIPCYNPKDIIHWIKIWLSSSSSDSSERLSEGNFPELVPWYNGFLGEIKKEGVSKINTYGCYEKKGDKIIISELPIGVWIDKYKEYLEDLLENKKIKNLKNYSKPDKIHFEITEFKESPLDISLLKLKTTLSTTNMVLFDKHNRIRKYNSIEEILSSFCIHRLKYYEMRKEYIQKQLEYEYLIVSNKMRFLEAVMSNKIVLQNKSDDEIYAQLKKMKLEKVEESYDYLLNLPIKSFSNAKITQLKEKISGLETKINYIKNATTKELWLNDLKKLENI